MCQVGCLRYLFIQVGIRNGNVFYDIQLGYYDEGFLYVQYAVETTLAKLLFKNDSALDSYDIRLQRFSYPTYIDDKFIYTLQGVLPLTLILSFIFSVINITKLVLVEKEQRLKVIQV